MPSGPLVIKQWQWIIRYLRIYPLQAVICHCHADLFEGSTLCIISLGYHMIHQRNHETEANIKLHDNANKNWESYIPIQSNLPFGHWCYECWKFPSYIHSGDDVQPLYRSIVLCGHIMLHWYCFLLIATWKACSFSLLVNFTKSICYAFITALHETTSATALILTAVNCVWSH